MTQIKIISGNRKVLKCSVVYEFDNIDLGISAGDPYPLTGYTARFSIKQGDDADTPPIFTVNIPTIEDELGGIIKIVLPPIQTAKLSKGKYYYDVEIANANREDVQTPIKSIATVINDVSK